MAPVPERVNDAGMAQDFHHLTWPKRTERLVIRPAVEADAAACWLVRGHPEVAYWMTTPLVDEATHIEEFVDPKRLPKTLVFELDGVIIGDLMLSVEDAWAQTDMHAQADGVHAELGWAISPAHGGKGYATEAVRDLIRICFEELGIRRVTAECFADNESSWRLMERVGMRRESYAVQDALHRELGWADSATYALLASEWHPR